MESVPNSLRMDETLYRFKVNGAKVIVKSQRGTWEIDTLPHFKKYGIESNVGYAVVLWYLYRKRRGADTTFDLQIAMNELKDQQCKDDHCRQARRAVMRIPTDRQVTEIETTWDTVSLCLGIGLIVMAFVLIVLRGCNFALVMLGLYGLVTILDAAKTKKTTKTIAKTESRGQRIMHGSSVFI